MNEEVTSHSVINLKTAAQKKGLYNCTNYQVSKNSAAVAYSPDS